MTTAIRSTARARTARASALRWGVLVVVALAALVHVPFPFWGDQALFTYAAHGLRHGDRLYVDIWDYKQPGIFLWYLGAGSLFGFHEAGIHTGELIWSVAFAACIQQMMRSRVENRWVADVAPLFTVGAFYAAARAWDLTQIEYLVAFPMMLSLWAAADAGDEAGARRTRRLLLSGLAASVVVYFKLVYVLVPVVFWVYLLVDRRRREHARDTARDALVLVGGLAAPLLPLLVYFLSEHLLGTMWWTYITYPPKIVRSIDPPPFSRLRDGVSFFVENFAWLAAPALIGLSLLRAKDGRRRDPLVVGLVIWFVVGWGTVLIQNQWGYQFMLPLVALGLLAVYGADRLWSRWSAHDARNLAIAVTVVAAVLALYPAKQAAHAVKTLASDHFALTTSGRHEFEASFEPYYPDARAAAAFLSQPGRTPGAIHVEGNPLIQYLSGRPFALREHGWAPEQSDARLWKWTQDELKAARPPYLWVDSFSVDIMRERSRSTIAVIDSMYCPVQRVADGTWYALHGSTECTQKARL